MAVNDQGNPHTPSWQAWLDAHRTRRDEAAGWLRSAWEYQRWPRRSIAPYSVLLPVSRSIVHGAWINPGQDWAESALREPWHHELFLHQAEAERSAERSADMLEDLCERERPHLEAATQALGLPRTACWLEASERRAALVDAILAFAADRSYLVEDFPPQSRTGWESYVMAADVVGLDEARFGEEHRRLRQGRELLEMGAIQPAATSTPRTADRAALPTPRRRRRTKLGDCDEILAKVRNALDAMLRDPDVTDVTKKGLCNALGIDEVETLTSYEDRCSEFSYERELVAAMRRFDTESGES